ncbi:MAG TPA: hypothetical protein VKQ36_04620 [Ktedonobacterales bacterium]|nr:hypothetical protein [Ktedonobacterales bacterium]
MPARTLGVRRIVTAGGQAARNSVSALMLIARLAYRLAFNEASHLC